MRSGPKWRKASCRGSKDKIETEREGSTGMIRYPIGDRSRLYTSRHNPIHPFIASLYPQVFLRGNESLLINNRQVWEVGDSFPSPRPLGTPVLVSKDKKHNGKNDAAKANDAATKSKEHERSQIRQLESWTAVWQPGRSQKTAGNTTTAQWIGLRLHAEATNTMHQPSLRS